MYELWALMLCRRRRCALRIFFIINVVIFSAYRNKPSDRSVAFEAIDVVRRVPLARDNAVSHGGVVTMMK